MDKRLQSFLSNIVVVTLLAGSADLMAESAGGYDPAGGRASAAASVSISVVIPVGVALHVTETGVVGQANVEEGAIISTSQCISGGQDACVAPDATSVYTATAL